MRRYWRLNPNLHLKTSTNESAKVRRRRRIPGGLPQTRHYFFVTVARREGIMLLAIGARRLVHFVGR